jgi:3-isopropylmalate/(R)-2-methylmalate dehydratase large subunit
VKIDQAVIGSCANGRFEDILIAATILKNKKIHPRVRFLIQPASWEVYRQCLKVDIIPSILDSGAQFLEPGCGTCQPIKGVLAPGEACISAGTRNYKGRLGSTDAFIYLAGPATVATSALAGEITNPREVLNENYPR